MCADNSYYVGSTNNLLQRLKDHNQHKGADYTSKRSPCVVIWFQTFNNRKQAFNKELEIKKFSRAKKEKLIFSENTIWKHHKGNKYIILRMFNELILYSELNVWNKYLDTRKIKGQQCQVWLRDKNQWLDWIDKKNKLLRFNLVTAV